MCVTRPLPVQALDGAIPPRPTSRIPPNDCRPPAKQDAAAVREIERRRLPPRRRAKPCHASQSARLAAPSLIADLTHVQMNLQAAGKIRGGKRNFNAA